MHVCVCQKHLQMINDVGLHADREIGVALGVFCIMIACNFLKMTIEQVCKWWSSFYNLNVFNEFLDTLTSLHIEDHFKTSINSQTQLVWRKILSVRVLIKILIHHHYIVNVLEQFGVFFNEEYQVDNNHLYACFLSANMLVFIFAEEDLLHRMWSKTYIICDRKTHTQHTQTHTHLETFYIRNLVFFHQLFWSLLCVFCLILFAYISSFTIETDTDILVLALVPHNK